MARPASLLDVGSGSGRHLEAFNNLNIGGEGIEPSENMVGQALARGVTVHRGFLQDLISTRKFNLCTALFAVVNHIAPEDLARFFENVRALLSTDGFLAIETWSNNVRPTGPTERYFTHLGHGYIRRVVPQMISGQSWDLEISICEESSGNVVASEQHRIYSHSSALLREAGAAFQLFNVDESPIHLNPADRFHETHVFKLRD